MHHVGSDGTSVPRGFASAVEPRHGEATLRVELEIVTGVGFRAVSRNLLWDGVAWAGSRANT